MNSRERVLAALHLKQPDRVPFVEPHIDDGISKRLMGRDDFTLVDLAKKLNMDGIYINDYLPKLYSVTKEIGGINHIVDGLIKSESDLSIIELPDPNDPSFYDPLKRFVEKYSKSNLALFAKLRLGICPTMLSMGIESFSYAIYENPRLIEKLLDLYTEWSIRVIENLNESGLDFLLTADDIAFKTNTLMSPTVFRELLLPRIKFVADAIKLPWVFHSDGNFKAVIDDLLTLGMNGMHPFEPGAMDIVWAKKEYGDRICIMGNIDLHYTLTLAQPEEVEREVKSRIADLAPGGGYIVASANSLTNYCKTENVLMMAKAVRKYGKYPINIDAF